MSAARLNHQFTGIQLLRFAAAMLVVVMHLTQAISVYITGAGAGHYWENGSAGVDIFFVISGFVMASSTSSTRTAGAASRVSAAWIFMQRRIVRIAPLYWLYTLLKVALLLAAPGLALKSSIEPAHLAATLLFIPALSPWGAIQPLLPVGWTLNFEMLFYVVFAAAMALGMPRIRFCVAVFLALMVAGQYLGNWVPLAFYAHSIVFEFILGVCIAHLFSAKKNTPTPGLLALGAGVFLMFAVDWGASPDRLTTWGLAAALVVLGAVWLEPWIARSRLAGKCALLGDASYSIYLSHTFVVPAGVLACKQMGVQNGVLILLIVGLAVVAAGCASYLLMERPMTRALQRLLLRRQAHAGAGASGSPGQQPSTQKAMARTPNGRYIYIACPWGPKGGGMFKVADYLIQAQASTSSAETAALRPLDTRGGANAAFSLLVLAAALCRLVLGRLSGQLAGVHVNMAERLSLFRKSVVVIASCALGLPVVLHLHAAQLHHFYRRLAKPLQAVTRWVFSLPSTCIVLGTEARRFVIEELGVPAHRVEIVINGVPEPTVPRRRADAADPQRVLFVGNISERKGVSDLLQSLTLPGFHRDRIEVSIVGGGDVQAYTEKALKLGLEDFVRFEGWSDQQDVARFMANADVLVLPSYDEGLPLVILEALANGVAVVCSPVGEIPSVLTDRVNAFFVRPSDVQGLATALQQLLQQPELRKALERNGRTLYEQHFSLTRFFASIARIHQRHFGVAGQSGQASLELQGKTP